MDVLNKNSIIKVMRTYYGLSQEEATDGVCSVQTLSRIENGRVGVKPDIYAGLLDRMCQCGADFFYMFSGNGIKCNAVLETVRDVGKSSDTLDFIFGHVSFFEKGFGMQKVDPNQAVSDIERWISQNPCSLEAFLDGKAVILRKKDVTSLMLLACIWISQGRFDNAENLICFISNGLRQEGVRLEEGEFLRTVCTLLKGIACFFEGHYDEAVNEFAVLLEASIKEAQFGLLAQGSFWLGLCYIKEYNFAEAIKKFEIACSVSRLFDQEFLHKSYAVKLNEGKNGLIINGIKDAFSVFTEEHMKRSFFSDLDCLGHVRFFSAMLYGQADVSAFVDDINLAFSIKNDGTELLAGRNETGFSEDNFEVKELKVACGKRFESIRNSLAVGRLVYAETLFDAVPAYCWYKEEGPYSHKRHFVTIVGVDDKNCFFVDDETVLDKKRNKKIYENSIVNVIAIKDMETAFNKHCRLWTIRYPLVRRNSEQKAADLKKMIINNYYNDSAVVNGEYRVFTGDRAYSRLLSEIEKDDEAVGKISAFTSSWEFNMLRGRHRLLRRFLYKDSNGAEARALDECIKCLNVLCSLTFKNTLRCIPNYRGKIFEMLGRLRNAEATYIKMLKG